MWFSGKRKQASIRSVVGEGTLLTGEVRIKDGMRIDGEVRGDIVHIGEGPGLVVVAEKARIHGKVKAGHVIINGEVHGPVIATELLELLPKASIFGDVRYQALEMHQGASIVGDLRPLDAVERPALKLAASNSK